MDRPRQEAFEDEAPVHFDSFIRMPLLNNLLVSFRWRPLITDMLLEELSLIDDTEDYANENRTTSSQEISNADVDIDASFYPFPHFILIGRLYRTLKKVIIKVNPRYDVNKYILKVSLRII